MATSGRSPGGDMNGITVVLLALAVHMGGTDVDMAPNGGLQWFQDARLEGEWTMAAAGEGVYRFGSSSGEIVVRRLPEPDLTFAVTATDGTGAPDFLSILSLPAETLAGSAPSVSVRRDDIVSAFTRAGPTEWTNTPIEGGAVSESAVPVSSELSVRRSERLVTAGDPESGQVLILRY